MFWYIQHRKISPPPSLQSADSDLFFSLPCLPRRVPPRLVRDRLHKKKKRVTQWNKDNGYDVWISPFYFNPSPTTTPTLSHSPSAAYECAYVFLMHDARLPSTNTRPCGGRAPAGGGGGRVRTVTAAVRDGDRPSRRIKRSPLRLPLTPNPSGSPPL